MAKRKRRRPRTIQLLASALAEKLTQSERDTLREAHAPAQHVIRLFTPDHIVLHCFGGSDLWWNLDMRRRDPTLKEKDARDTSIAAKAARIGPKWEEFTRNVLSVKKRKRKSKSRWASRPFRSKGGRR